MGVLLTIFQVAPLYAGDFHCFKGVDKYVGTFGKMWGTEFGFKCHLIVDSYTSPNVKFSWNEGSIRSIVHHDHKMINIKRKYSIGSIFVLFIITDRFRLFKYYSVWVIGHVNNNFSGNSCLKLLCFDLILYLVQQTIGNTALSFI